MTGIDLWLDRASGYATASWTALGSNAHLVVAEGARLQAVQAAAAELLDQVDRACSRFRPDSDLTRANAGAGGWVAVDPLLVAAVQAALTAAEQTEGLVDPTLGTVLAGWGYDRDLAQVQADPDGAAAGRDPAAIPAPVSGADWRQVQVDPDGGVLVPAGCAVDLGATGKAFAADLIAGSVPDLIGTALVVSLGGDVAVGVRSDDDDPPHWPVRVTEQPEQAAPAEQAGASVETVEIVGGGLATSTTTRRRWLRAGRPVHHLLDPRTRRPVDPIWRTATVAAQTCLAANTASTAAIILGEAAETWLADRDLAARLVGRDGRVLRCCGWPEGTTT